MPLLKRKPAVRGKRKINVEIPIELHDMVKKLAIDKGMTVTTIIISYLEFLKATHNKDRRPLHAESNSNFCLDDR